MREGRREAALASSGTRCLAGVRMRGTTFRPDRPVRHPPQSRPAGPGSPSPSSVGGAAPHAPIPEERAHGRVVDARDTSQGRSGPPTRPRIFFLLGAPTPRPHAPDSRVPSKAAGAQRRLEGGTISRSVPLPRLLGAAPPTPPSRRSVRTVVSWTRGIPRRAARPTHPPSDVLSVGAEPPRPRPDRPPAAARPSGSLSLGREGGGEGRSLSCRGALRGVPASAEAAARTPPPESPARPRAAARAAHGRIGTNTSSSVPVAPSRSTKPYALSITGGKARLGFCIAVVASGCARPRRRIGLLGEGEARLGAVGVDAL